jgi:hypothetical protein
LGSKTFTATLALHPLAMLGDDGFSCCFPPKLVYLLWEPKKWEKRKYSRIQEDLTLSKFGRL